MAGAPPDRQAAERTIGLTGLTLVAVTSMIGSGWLFAPLLAAKAAGPAAMLAWLVGGLAMLVIALTFAEVSAILPVSGGIARIPEATHGPLVGMVMGWTSWIGCAAVVSLETLILLRYLAPLAPWLYRPGASDGSATDFTLWGWLLALALLALITLTILFGARLFARVNSLITALKLILPIVVAATLLSLHLDFGNFTDQGGFAPYGVQGLFAALSTGGVIFSFLGFRNVVDMAGDVRRPQVTQPAALVLALLIGLAIYGALQFALIASLPDDALSEGWAKLHFGATLGPFAAIAALAGLLWLGIVIHAAAIVSPFGTGLGMMGAGTRLLEGMAAGRMLPLALAFLTHRGIPPVALAVNLALSLALLFLPFDTLVTLVTAALALSLVTGPLALLVFRRELPDLPRAFRLPLAPAFAYLAVLTITLLLYWGGWDTMRYLLALVALGALLYPVLRQAAGPASEWRRALWLLAWLGGTALLSWLGNFGGGIGWIPFGWDLAAAAALAALCQALALASRRRRAAIEAMLAHHGLGYP
ncbi:MAG: APC family permease [Sneathiellaceae bacterium]